MGHATHFLRRLDRLSTPQLDYALELYRSSALVEYLLRQARLPDGADRVALALEDRDGGPHILVTRDGAFVTCLGAGMAVGGLPVISRGQIDRLGGQYDGLCEARERVRDRRETRRLMGAVANNGRALSREDFSALAAMMPILDKLCVSVLLDLAEWVINFQRRYTRSRYRRLTTKVKHELRVYWNAMWAVGHLLALCGTRGRALCGGLAADPRMGQVSFDLSRVATRIMYPPVVLRGGWAAARMGRPVVAEAKQALSIATYLEVMETTLPLVLTGLRHRRARVEVHKLLSRGARAIDERTDVIDRALSEVTLKMWLSLFETEGEEGMRAFHRVIGVRMARELAEGLPADHPLRYDHDDAVPDELALALPVSVDSAIYGGAEAMMLLGAVVPWLATADASAFYLPAAMIDAYAMPCDLAAVRAQLEAQHAYFFRDRPIRARPTPGRNQPCGCGSGVKYKRCCAGQQARARP